MMERFHRFLGEMSPGQRASPATTVVFDKIDAFDATPVIDLKPHGVSLVTFLLDFQEHGREHPRRALNGATIFSRREAYVS
jgi:hypothetical protein